MLFLSVGIMSVILIVVWGLFLFNMIKLVSAKPQEGKRELKRAIICAFIIFLLWVISLVLKLSIG